METLGWELRLLRLMPLTNSGGVCFALSTMHWLTGPQSPKAQHDLACPHVPNVRCTAPPSTAHAQAWRQHSCGPQ